MIRKLSNSSFSTSKTIYEVFQASYAVEAKLLNVRDFPPLRRTAEDIRNSGSEFYGFYEGKELAGVVEIGSNTDLTEIQGLVVHPRFFRQGIAKKLVLFVLQSFQSKKYIVETAVENTPACDLYLKLDFKKSKRWNTPDGYHIIRFERKQERG